jgi:hypothetical protein
MIGFIGVPLQLHSTITAHSQWLSATRSIPCWTTSVFSSTVTNDESLLTPWTTLDVVCLSRKHRVRVRVSQNYFTTGGLPPISSSWRQAPWDSRSEVLFSNWTLVVMVLMQHPLWREDRYVVYYGCWSSLAQLFWGLSLAGLMTKFYCLRFETPPTCSRIFISQEQGGPVVLPGTRFHSCRLLRLAGLRLRYSTPLPFGFLESTLIHFWCHSFERTE